MAPPPEPEDDAAAANDSQMTELVGTPRSIISTSDFGSSEWELVIENDAASRIQAARRGQLQRRRIARTEVGMQLKEDSLFAIGALAGTAQETVADRGLSDRLNETRASLHSSSTMDKTGGPLLFNDGETVTGKEQKAMRAIDKAKQFEIERLKGEVEEWDMSIELVSVTRFRLSYRIVLMLFR